MVQAHASGPLFEKLYSFRNSTLRTGGRNGFVRAGLPSPCLDKIGRERDEALTIIAGRRYHVREQNGSPHKHTGGKKKSRRKVKDSVIKVATLVATAKIVCFGTWPGPHGVQHPVEKKIPSMQDAW